MGEDGWIETEMRVRYAESDQMGVAHHANFLVWFEAARVEYLRARGFSYRAMEQDDDCLFPVVEARCRYRAPAHFDDLIRLRTRVTRRRGPILTFAYEAVRVGDGVLLAEGETTHVVVDRKFEPRDLPDKYQLPVDGA